MAKENTFTVEMGEEFYSIAPHGGNSGAPVPYGETACVRVNNIVFYCHVEDPNDYPEGGEPPEVYMVEAAVVVPSEMTEVDDEEEDEEEQAGSAVVEEEDEEDEDEDEEEQLGPELVEEEEDENLPPAQDQR